MAQNKFAIARYRLIDELLRKKSYVKTKEIVDLCRAQLGFEVTQRTIQMDIEALKNDSFLGCYFPILYCKQKKAYYYFEEPICPFFTLHVTDSELEIFRKLKLLLKNKISEEDYTSLCSLLSKIEDYRQNRPI